jgi:hypothetical protein
MMRIFSVIGNNEVKVIYVEQIVVPVIPFMLGSYCIYSSTKNGTILRVRTTQNKSGKFSLKELEKDNKLQSLQDFLKQKLSTKLSVNA